MSTIKSPLGNRSFSSGPKQVFSVPDETVSPTTGVHQSSSSNELFELPGETSVPLTPTQFNELQAKKQAIRIAQQRPTSEARQRIELLTGIGRLETEVEIEGHKFTMQTLKSREMREVIRAAAKVELVSEQIFELRLHTLARAIIYIDRQLIDLVLGGNSIELRLAFIDECEENIVNKLYAAYSEMIKQNENKFAVKSDSEAQEIVEEIKK